VPLKTTSSRREIRLEPDLASLLERHKEMAFGLGWAKPQGYDFTTSEDTPLYHRNVALRGLKRAADAAGIDRHGLPSLSCHDLWHTYGSHLVLSGLDCRRVSRQLGHARPSITLDLYSFEAPEGASFVAWMASLSHEPCGASRASRARDATPCRTRTGPGFLAPPARQRRWGFRTRREAAMSRPPIAETLARKSSWRRSAA
jgi:Phage integrase family